MHKNEKQTNYAFTVIWSDSGIAVAIDKVQTKSFFIPITTFYVWPRENSWELIKSDLKDRPWLTQIERDKILNNYTKIIKYWTMYQNLSFNKEKKINLKQVNLDSKILNFRVIAVI